MSQPAVAVAENSERRSEGLTQRNLSSDFWYNARSRLIAFWMIASWTPVVCSFPRIAEGTWTAFACTILGWICFAAGLTFRLWATLYIGGRKAASVVTQGPYSICRNPLYLGTFLIYLSQPLFLKSVLFGIGLLVPLALYLLAVIPAEEQHLRGRFGQAYDAYLRSAPRFWPKWSLYQSTEFLDVEARTLAKEFKRACGWLSLPFIAQALCLLRSDSRWPAWLPWF